jgi:alpha-D-ribose 1-methylphosphonate 5-triphosphate synthase subunit PhnH
MSRFAIMVDKVDADPVTIHKDSCTYYTDRKPDATTTVWCQVDTLEDAEELARRLDRNGAKCAACCLDGGVL